MKCFKSKFWQWDCVKFEMFYPTIKSVEVTNVKDNNKSCLLKETSQFGSIVLTGDIEKEAFKTLFNHNIKSDALEVNIHKPSIDAIFSRAQYRLKSDVLIAPHHGSKTSSTSDFVQAVGAQHAVFMMGYLNRFNILNH